MLSLDAVQSLYIMNSVSTTQNIDPARLDTAAVVYWKDAMMISRCGINVEAYALDGDTLCDQHQRAVALRRSPALADALECGPLARRALTRSLTVRDDLGTSATSCTLNAKKLRVWPGILHIQPKGRSAWAAKRIVLRGRRELMRARCSSPGSSDQTYGAWPDYNFKAYDLILRL